jgi:hypothetical protein
MGGSSSTKAATIGPSFEEETRHGLFRWPRYLDGRDARLCCRPRRRGGRPIRRNAWSDRRANCGNDGCRCDRLGHKTDDEGLGGLQPVDDDRRLAIIMHAMLRNGTEFEFA